jgi:hypothetical protein
MPKYVIERDLPGAGALSPEDLRGISQRSNEVLDGLAGRAQWLQTYVTDDKLFCVYIADHEETIVEHANGGGFPCTAVRRVRTVIDPTTGEASN